MPREDEELKGWLEEIDKAREQRKIYENHWNYWEQVFDDNLWGIRRFEDYGRRNVDSTRKDFFPMINELESIDLSILPKILFSEPIYEVSSVLVFPNDNTRLTAMIYEILATVLHNNIGLNDNLEDIALDTLNLGGGLHKVGMFSEMESSEMMFESEDYMGSDSIFSGYVSPLNFLWDYRVSRWKDKRWIAEEIIKPTQEVKDSNLYSNTRDLKGSLTVDYMPEAVKRSIMHDKSGDLTRLVEVHDLVNKKVITFADGHNKILRKDDDYRIEIYDQLEFIPTRPRRFWGKSIAQSIEEHMIALAKVYYYMMSHSKNAGITKVLAESSLLTPEASRALESNKDFEIVPMDGVSQGNPVQELKFAGVGSDWYVNYNMIEENIRKISGVTEQERGSHESGVETAYEVAKLAAASDSRNQWRIMKIGRYIENIMTKILTLASEYLPPEKIATLVGLPPEYAFIIEPFDKMKLKVKYGSTAVNARQEKLNRVVTFVQLAMQAGMQINPQAFLELVSDALGLELSESMLLLQQQTQTAGGGGVRAGVGGAIPSTVATEALPAVGGE